MDVRQPTVRRLCVAASAGPAGLLAPACRPGGFERWFVESDRRRGVELAFAPPGCDEPAAIGDLIMVLRRLVADGHHGPTRVTVAFHVGMTTLDENGFGGAAVERVHAMVEEFAPPVSAKSGDAGRGLAVVMSAGLFEDLQGEGMPRLGWRYAAGSNAWLRVYDPFAPIAPRRHFAHDSVDGAW